MEGQECLLPREDIHSGPPGCGLPCLLLWVGGTGGSAQSCSPPAPLGLQCWALLSSSLLGSDLASLKEAELPSEVTAQLQGLSREAEIVSGKARELPQDSPTAGRSLKGLAELSCSQIIQERGREDPEARDL